MNSVVRVTPQGKHCFFGYYDKSPWNNSENRLLYSHSKVYNKDPKPGKLLEIGYIDLENNNSVHPLAETATWNFQQGCMLQWMGDETLLYNAQQSNRYISRVIDLEGEEQASFPWPMYAVSHDKNIGVSVNFSRIHTFRKGYGYLGIPFIFDDADGIRMINLKSGKSSIIVTYKQIKAMLGKRLSDKYWIDHILFSPNDQHIAFLFRTLTQNGTLYSRLFFYDIDGSSGLKCLLDTGMASHADWHSDDTFAIWARKKKIVSSIQKNYLSYFLRPLIRQIRKIGVPQTIRRNIYGDRFLMINVKKNHIKTFADSIPVSEGGGHFTFCHQGDWMLNDTDIDKRGYRKLMLYHLPTENRFDIAKFYTPTSIHRTSYRCDLHPRWSPSGLKICVDSVHEGFRGIYQIDVTQYIKRIRI